jgi:peptidoglycan/LPS O-acetylase OafA/YrhL
MDGRSANVIAGPTGFRNRWISENAMSTASDRVIVSRLNVLDGLRGAAMSLVVLGHLWPGWVRPVAISIVPRGAEFGLDLFFFVSGFGIFYLFVRATVEGGPEQNLRDFVVRRVAKIFPSYYLCIVAVVALGWWNRDPGLAPLGVQILAHVFFLQNLFPQTLYGLDGVMWSLAVECEFYLLFAYTRKLATRRPLAYVATLIAIATVYRCWATRAPASIGDFLDSQLPAMLDMFAFGMLCAYLYRYTRKYHSALAQRHTFWTVIAVVASLAIYGQFFVVVAANNDPHFPVLLAPFVRTVDGLLIAIFATASLFAVERWRRVIGNRALAFVGGISYNVYLYHQVVFLQLLHHFGPSVSPGRRAAIGAVAVAGTLVLAAFLKRYYEQAFIDYARRFETGRSDWVKPLETEAIPAGLRSRLAGSGAEDAVRAASD